MKEGLYDVAFRKKRLLNLDLRKSNLKIKVWNWRWLNSLASKLPNLSRCYDFDLSQAVRTEVSFQNYNEKEKKKIFGSISPQNLLFEQVIAIKSG